MLKQALAWFSGMGPHPRRIVVGVLCFTGGVLAATWLTALTLSTQEREAVLSDARAELVGAQKTIAPHIGRTFETVLATLTAVDLWLGDAYFSGGLRSLDAVGIFIERMQAHHEQPVPVQLIDEHGTLFSFAGKEPGGMKVSDRDYFRQIAGKPPGSMHIGTPIESRITGQHAIPVIMAARPNGAAVAYILSGIRIAPIVEAYRDLLITAPAISGIFREDGALLFRFPDPGNLTGVRIERYDFKNFFKHRPSADVIYENTLLSDDVRLVAYKRLETLPLATYSSFSVDDLVARARAKTLVFHQLAALASLLTVGVAAWLIVLVAQREREARRVRMALKETEAASRAKSDFLATMSHELRTPLNAILGFSAMIRRALLGPLPAKYQEYAEDIGNSGKHLLGLIDQMLDLTRVEAGAILPADELLDPGRIVDEMTGLLRPLIAERNIELTRDIPPGLPALRADQRMIRQMLLNMLSNALRYGGTGARVTVSARVIDGSMEIAVSDNGPGIPAAAIPHIFEPFGRGDAKIARKEGGLGLGLPITKSLIEAHHGRIQLRSYPGQGTTVILHFPPDRVAHAAEPGADGGIRTTR